VTSLRVNVNRKMVVFFALLSFASTIGNANPVIAAGSQGFPSCARGNPGSVKARWKIKTSLTSDANVTNATTLQAGAMTNAPDLLLNAVDLHALSYSTANVKAAWVSHEQMSAILAKRSASPQAVFLVTLPRFSAAAYQAAFAAAPPDYAYGAWLPSGKQLQ
jgi:hypothetical protein